ncbi:MAG TPA: apolipoprotein N-acyltransferase, partial [Candidatus Binatia bacterium]|nr:apolipoprotein N-acyltransferase [Candidatus Binatia bacterium]
GLTFVLLLANDGVLRAIGGAQAGLRRALAPTAWVAALVVALAGYGAVRSAAIGVDRREPPLTAGVVQANIAQYDRMRAFLGTYEAVRTILDAHFDLSATLVARGDLDLLVWPETVYPTTFGSPKSADGAAFDREIAGFASRAGVPLVFGSYDVEDGREFNAAFFLDARAPAAPAGPMTFETYRKASLFPLTERVPALLDSDLVRRWLPWLGTWKPGAGGDVVAVTLRGGRRLLVAPLICYDVLDPRLPLAAVRRGAELILTLSNDSWFDAGAGPRLHLVGAAFRSVETHRPQLRATNTGITAAIDPLGTITAVAPLRERTTLVATLTPTHTASSPYLRYGDWLGPTALATATVIMAAALRRLLAAH